MANDVIEFDVSNSDPEAAISSGNFESPQPGIYTVAVKSVTPGFSKNNDGSLDKNRPRVEVIFQVQDPPYKGSQLWYYLTFGEAALWKLDQFLQVFGIATANKRKGSFKPSQVEGKKCKVRIRAGKDNSNNYRGEVAAVLPLTAESNGASASSADDADIFGDSDTGTDDTVIEGTATEATNETVDEPSDDDLFADESADEPATPTYTEAELKPMSPPQIGEIAATLGISVKGKKKSEVIREILEKQMANDDDEEMPF